MNRNDRHVSTLNAVLHKHAPFLASETRLDLVNTFAAAIGTTGPATPPEIIHNGAVTRLLVYMAHQAGLTVAELRGRSRKADIARVRWDIFWILTKRYGLNQSTVARIMKRDHTTVGYGLNRVVELQDHGKWTPPYLPEHIERDCRFGGNYDGG